MPPPSTHQTECLGMPLVKLYQLKRDEFISSKSFFVQGLREQWRDADADGTADSMAEHDAILREAVCLNIVKIGEEMKENGGEVKEDDVHVAMLANLQQIQDQEAEILLRDLSEKVSELRIILER